MLLLRMRFTDVNTRDQVSRIATSFWSPALLIALQFAFSVRQLCKPSFTTRWRKDAESGCSTGSRSCLLRTDPTETEYLGNFLQYGK